MESKFQISLARICCSVVRLLTSARTTSACCGVNDKGPYMVSCQSAEPQLARMIPVGE